MSQQPSERIFHIKILFLNKIWFFCSVFLIQSCPGQNFLQTGIFYAKTALYFQNQENISQ